MKSRIKARILRRVKDAVKRLGPDVTGERARSRGEMLAAAKQEMMRRAGGLLVRHPVSGTVFYKYPGRHRMRKWMREWGFDGWDEAGSGEGGRGVTRVEVERFAEGVLGWVLPRGRGIFGREIEDKD